MLLKQLFDQETWTYTYLLADPKTREAVIIDPVVEKVERDLKLIQELGLKLLYTLDTHIHADHVTGSGELRRVTGALSGVSAAASVACVDKPLTHGDSLRFGRYTLEVRSTPGHTDGCLTYVVEDNGRTMAFTGDALFVRGCGRTDFQQGDAATLYHSVHQQIYSLPEDTIVYPGHDYRGHTATTVAEEKAHNPRINANVSEAAFVKTMSELKLADPKFMDVAVPANLACGLEVNSAVDAPDAPFACNELDPTQLNALTDHLIVDVRFQDEFDGPLGHLPGSILAPLPELKTLASSWDRSKPILTVCHGGTRSRKACDILNKMGFKSLSNLYGGMLAFNALREVKA